MSIFDKTTQRGIEKCHNSCTEEQGAHEEIVAEGVVYTVDLRASQITQHAHARIVTPARATGDGQRKKEHHKSAS